MKSGDADWRERQSKGVKEHHPLGLTRSLSGQRWERSLPGLTHFKPPCSGAPRMLGWRLRPQKASVPVGPRLRRGRLSCPPRRPWDDRRLENVQPLGLLGQCGATHFALPPALFVWPGQPQSWTRGMGGKIPTGRKGATQAIPTFAQRQEKLIPRPESFGLRKAGRQ